MQIRVRFFSYFRELAGRAETTLELPPGASIRELLQEVERVHPALAKSAGSVLVAVGLDYQPRDYQLQSGDEVSIFPPVQGG